jgi:hypothetical protein
MHARSASEGLLCRTTPHSDRHVHDKDPTNLAGQLDVPPDAETAGVSIVMSAMPVGVAAAHLCIGVTSKVSLTRAENR